MKAPIANTVAPGTHPPTASGSGWGWARPASPSPTRSRRNSLAPPRPRACSPSSPDTERCRLSPLRGSTTLSMSAAANADGGSGSGSPSGRLTRTLCEVREVEQLLAHRVHDSLHPRVQLNFSRMLRTWFLTVFSLMSRSRAISRLLSPRATRLSTSSSRSVSLRRHRLWLAARARDVLNSSSSFAAIEGLISDCPLATRRIACDTSSMEASFSK